MSHTPPETFRTERLILRRPLLADARALFTRWARDEEVTRYLAWRPHVSLQESKEHIARCRVSWETGTEYVWFIDDQDNGELVGSLAARANEHGVNLGYALAREVWGQGLMTEALEPVVTWWLAQPGIFRVWATCDVDNRASARVLEKCGFELEGTLRCWQPHPNIGAEPRDALCYGRVRPPQGAETSAR